MRKILFLILISNLVSAQMSTTEIHSICKDLNITNYEIRNGVVNVDGDVDISNRNLKEIPIKFGRVKGNFNCSFNKLTSLKGSPDYVGLQFNCSHNKLKTLDGISNTIKNGLDCSYNKLTTLKGIPNRIVGFLYCNNNKLKTLAELPDSVIGDINWNNNKLNK